MDPTFDQLIAPWHDFFLAATAGAATFCGLLFVATSLNLEVIIRDEHLPLRAVTKLTFSLFLTVFFAGLLLLPPHPTGAAAAAAVAGVALVASGVPLWQALQLYQTHRRYRWTREHAAWMLIPLVLDLALLWTGIGLADSPPAFGALAVVLGVILAVAAGASWQLLVDVAQHKGVAAAEQVAAGRDRALERQLRNLVRAQRAANRRVQEPGRPAVPPAGRGDRRG